MTRPSWRDIGVSFTAVSLDPAGVEQRPSDSPYVERVYRAGAGAVAVAGADAVHRELELGARGVA